MTITEMRASLNQFEQTYGVDPDKTQVVCSFWYDQESALETGVVSFVNPTVTKPDYEPAYQGEFVAARFWLEF